MEKYAYERQLVAALLAAESKSQAPSADEERAM
jgi:hypothetical protein